MISHLNQLLAFTNCQPLRCKPFRSSSALLHTPVHRKGARLLRISTR